MKKIAVIAAHPDDEALGCGGTLLKSKKSGCELHILFMTNGISARSNVAEQEYDLRKQGVNAAMQFLVPTSYKLLQFPDNQLDSVPLLEVVKEVEQFLAQVQPDVMLTHSLYDLNIDHVVACRAALTAARPGSKTFVKQVMSFEVPSSTEWSVDERAFKPNYYFDISAVINEKKAYLKCYEGEMRPHPHSRSLENITALNQVRGASIHVPFAEAFSVLRDLRSEF